jgi:hypothetical protein
MRQHDQPQDDARYVIEGIVVALKIDDAVSGGMEI